jgi:predicted dehydrogenase
MKNLPIRIAVIGMGGWAAQHHRVLRVLEDEGLCRLVAASGRNPSAYEKQIGEWEFQKRGVRIFDDPIRMLDECGLDCVCIPTPIHTHAELHRECVGRGLAVILEKPPTLEPGELAEMLAVEATAAHKTEVAFLYIVDEVRQALKRRVQAGEFGTVKRASVIGMWPRSDHYYARNAWAGKLRAGSHLALDSSFGNALAHYVVNMLFWCGRGDPFAWAYPTGVEAEVYRAHEIEGADTFFVRARTADGVELCAATSHACARQIDREVVTCEYATIDWRVADSYTIRWNDGRGEESAPIYLGDLFAAIFRNYFLYLAGRAPRPTVSLADTTPFVHLHGLAYVSAGGIHPVDSAILDRSEKETGGRLSAIPGVEDAAEVFAENGVLPSAQGCAWAVPGRAVTPSEIWKFLPLVQSLAGGTP